MEERGRDGMKCGSQTTDHSLVQACFDDRSSKQRKEGGWEWREGKEKMGSREEGKKSTHMTGLFQVHTQVGKNVRIHGCDRSSKQHVCVCVVRYWYVWVTNAIRCTII